MIKKLKLTTIVLSVALLSGCGGSGSKSKSITEQISERNYVVIMHNSPNGICEDPRFIPLFTQNLQDEGISVTNVITHEEDNTASCALYGKSSLNCESVLYDEENPGNVACVVGLDRSPTNKNLKQIHTFDMSDKIITSTLQIM